MNTLVNIPLFLGSMRGPEIAIIVVAILLLFGAKRIPQLMRNVGKGIRGFKEGMNDMREEINRPLEKISTDDDKPAETTKKD